MSPNKLSHAFHVKDFAVRGGKVHLPKHPTRVKPFYTSKEHQRALLDEHTEELRVLQNMLYAANCYSLLVIFQAMDAAGKDAAIKHVMSGIDPQGSEVYSFKHPSTEELDHDFLWRTTRNLPERGRIGIFNRSYYEEVLIVRVHPHILQAQNLPRYNPKTIWDERYDSINDFERHLDENGTKVVKFFLNVSKDEQRERFLKRIDDPEKNWKFSPQDVVERSFWNKYMEAYEACLSHTSTKVAPWYIVPADDKKNTSLIVSQILIETLKDLKLSYPKLGDKRRRELQKLRKQLAREK
jgi:PPK2 family polyphosphate:nucleotide phosphotransferase